MPDMFSKRRIETPIRISFCRDVLESIFDECDNFNIDETGGRIIGHYNFKGNSLNIDVCGLIGSGPNARRSPTSFFQDGAHQEVIFRKIEAEHPDIEHLGNWHSHHVNGLNTLSSGDIDTYKKTVNHEKHNTDFFYALLVTGKNHIPHSKERYAVRHFLFKRGESSVREISPFHVKIVKKAPLFIDKTGKAASESEEVHDANLSDQAKANVTRLKDKEIIAYLYPGLKPFFSKQTNSLYWKGEIALIDATPVELLILESTDDQGPSYSVTIMGSRANNFQSKQLYSKRNFDSAWKAAISFERDLNHEIYSSIK